MTKDEVYQDFIKRMNQGIRNNKIPKKHFSNLFNANREIYTSNKFLVFAIGDIWLDPKLSYELAHLPSVDLNLKNDLA